MAEYTDYVEAKQLIDPNLEMVSPYPCLEEAAAASLTEDSSSSSARTSSSEHDNLIHILPINPIRMPNFPGPTVQKDVLEVAYSHFKKLPASEFDEIVKNNVIDIMKGLHGLEQLWMKRFHKEEKDGKEKAAKIEKQKNAKIEALETRITKLIAESIAIESENKQNGAAGKESDVTYSQLNQENKYLKNQNAELSKKLKNENSYYDNLQIRYNSRREDLKNVEKVCNELKELNGTLKAKNEENVLKIKELEEELKNAQQSFFARDDEIEKMELQHKKDLQNLQEQIQKLDKEKQRVQTEMQNYAEKEKTLNEKCSTLENEIVEFKRLNGISNDEIIKLQKKLQEMKKESESKMKISTEKEQSLKEKCSILENEKSENEKKFAETNQKNEELIADLQLKMDKLEADKQSLMEKISAVENVENEKFEELNQKYAELEIKEKLNSAEMNGKVNALEEENQKLKAKVFELETSSDYYEKELHETRSNYNDLLLKEQQSCITSRRITYENVEQGQNVATVPGDAINGQLHDQTQNFEAHHSFLVFENNQFKHLNSSLRTSFATLKTEYEQISKKLEDEKNSAISKHALLIQQNIQHFEEKNSGSSGNDEVVVPTKRKRKSLNPQQKQVQQQNITEKLLPDSNNNDIQFSAPENFASNNPGSSAQ
uniref:Uncharacterized protein n=1 Tax=Panagrolaimus sp. PS1159 TaxID=55785 RepID=A0AC35F6A5_9BILA